MSRAHGPQPPYPPPPTTSTGAGYIDIYTGQIHIQSVYICTYTLHTYINTNVIMYIYILYKHRRYTHHCIISYNYIHIWPSPSRGEGWTTKHWAIYIYIYIFVYGITSFPYYSSTTSPYQVGSVFPGTPGSSRPSPRSQLSLGCSVPLSGPGRSWTSFCDSNSHSAWHCGFKEFGFTYKNGGFLHVFTYKTWWFPATKWSTIRVSPSLTISSTIFQP